MDSSVERNGRWKNVFSSDFPEMSRSEDLNVTGYSSDAYYDEASLSRSRNSRFDDESSSVLKKYITIHHSTLEKTFVFFFC